MVEIIRGFEEAARAQEMPDPARQNRKAGDDEVSEAEDDACEEDAVDFDELIVSGDKADGASGARRWTPPSFMEREAYAKLSAEGLTGLPPVTGVGIRYHKSSQQWHGTFDGKNVEPKWHASLRSERKAILMCLHAIWEWFSKTHPQDKDAREHVELLHAQLEAA